MSTYNTPGAKRHPKCRKYDATLCSPTPEHYAVLAIQRLMRRFGCGQEVAQVIVEQAGIGPREGRHG